jgi:hypothetical protein
MGRSAEANRAAVKKHYDNNKEYYLQKNRAAQLRKVKFIQELKSSTPCTDCGKRYPYWVMDFDHLDGSSKDFNVSKMSTYGWARIQQEIDKCEIVCSNCHRERTHARLVKE